MARQKKEPTNTAKIRLNELGAKWKQFSPITDKAAYEAYWLEIWQMLFEIYYPYLKTEADLNAFEKTIEKTRKSFDPAKGTLSSFFTTHLNYDRADAIEEELKWNPNERLDKCITPAGEDDDLLVSRNESLAEKEETTGLSTVEDNLFFDSAFFELSSQIIHFTSNHNKKSGNATRRNYFQLFYTSGVINFVKMSDTIPLFQRRRDVEAALKMPFVHFCMEDNCITLTDIYNSQLKYYSEVVEAKETSHERISIPLKNEVGISYLKRVEGKSVSKSTYSEQKSAYNAEMLEVLRSKNLI